MGYNSTRLNPQLFLLTLLPSFAPIAMRVERSMLALLVLAAAGCASVSPPQAPAEAPPGPFVPSPAAPVPPAPSVPPPANINLQGFPLEYRQGYADGCTSASGAERKNAARFASDGQYRTGWQDGNALCRKR